MLATKYAIWSCWKNNQIKQFKFKIHFLSNEQKKNEAPINQSSEGPGIAQFNQEKEMAMDIIFVID